MGRMGLAEEAVAEALPAVTVMVSFSVTVTVEPTAQLPEAAALVETATLLALVGASAGRLDTG